MKLLCSFFVFTMIYAQISKAQTPATNNQEKQIYQIGNDVSFGYKKPHILQSIKEIPKNVSGYAKSNWNKKGAIVATGVVLSTVALIVADQDIIDGGQQFGRYINLSGESKFKNISPISFAEISVPQNLNSWFYYAGDGLAHVPMTASFLLYGWLGKDNRALQTGQQLIEGYIVMGTVTQLLKHITGRESPFKASEPRGVWRFLPNQIDYHNSVPKYDAFPSGHLATIMLALTVISENYPEKKIVKPLGYTLLALCAYSMFNNGVHWASDYPLSIALGYSYGKYIVNRYRTVQKKTGEFSAQKFSFWNKLHILPIITPFGAGVGLRYELP